MPRMSVLSNLVEQSKANRPADKILADLGPVVTKKGRPTKATLEMLQPKPVRKAKVAVVEIVKPKNPIQIRHIRADLQPSGKYALVGSDTVTDCGRIVVKQMTRKNPPTGATVTVCPHCVERGHTDRAFQIVRGQVKLLPVAANKAK